MTIMHWIFVLVGLVSGGLLVYGVATHRKRKDQGDKTWLENFKVRPPWTPLMIMPSSEMKYHYPINPVLQWSIDFWNQEVGIGLFKGIGELNRTGQVIPIMLETERYQKAGVSSGDKLSAAYTVLHHDQEGFVSAPAIYIVIQPSFPAELFKRALAHELGHCLGLDHDDARASVMYRTLSPGEFHVTEKDKTSLKKAYG